MARPGRSGERATALVRSFKRDLDRNRAALREIQGERASRTYALTEGANPRPPHLVPVSRDLNDGRVRGVPLASAHGNLCRWPRLISVAVASFYAQRAVKVRPPLAAGVASPSASRRQGGSPFRAVAPRVPRSRLRRVDQGDCVFRRDQLSQGNARREVAELASALRGPQELCEHMRLWSGIALPCAASHRKEWRLAYRGLRLDR
jgi:hypothetical protein